jgi:hypothetical protein
MLCGWKQQNMATISAAGPRWRCSDSAELRVAKSCSAQRDKDYEICEPSQLFAAQKLSYNFFCVPLLTVDSVVELAHITVRNFASEFV